MDVEYTNRLEQWEMCGDLYAGEGKLKEVDLRCATYIKKMPKQSDESYNQYVKRASLYNAFAHTIDMYTGLAFVKGSQKNTAGLQYIERPDYSRTMVDDCAHKILHEILVFGGYGLYIVMPKINEASLLDIENDVMKQPYYIGYNQRSIKKYKEDRGRLQLVDLADKMIKDGKDVSVIRRLTMIEGVFHEKIIDSEGKEISDDVPEIHGAPMKEIPFFWITQDGSVAGYPKPPLLDLAYMNISHYQTSADVEYASYYLAIPTPVFCGFSALDDENKVRLGGGGLRTPDPAARAYYLEFSGAGMAALEARLEKKEKYMAILGASLLTNDSIQAAEAIRMKLEIGNTKIVRIIRQFERTFTEALRYMERMIRPAGNDDISYSTTIDEVQFHYTVDEIVKLVALVQAGTLPEMVLYRSLVASGMISDDMDYNAFLSEFRGMNA